MNVYLKRLLMSRMYLIQHQAIAVCAVHLNLAITPRLADHQTLDTFTF